MSFPVTHPQFEANGNVSPRRILTVTPGTANRAAQAVDGSAVLIGISGDNTRFAPNSPADDGFNAIAGETLIYHGPGQITNVDVGATAITDLSVPLTADNNGKAVPATTLNWVIGFPLVLAAAGDTVPVYVVSPFRFALS